MTMESILNSSNASTKPSIGETNSDPSTLQTCCHSTPSFMPRPCVSAVSTAMPISAPISACELELGMPNHQVPTFQNSAPMNTAASIPTATPPPGGESTSGGMSSTSAYATAMPPAITPRKFQMPDHTTAKIGFKELV